MAEISCRGRLMLYAPDEGDCELGDGCAVYSVRWTDHGACTSTRIGTSAVGSPRPTR